MKSKLSQLGIKKVTLAIFIGAGLVLALVLRLFSDKPREVQAQTGPQVYISRVEYALSPLGCEGEACFSEWDSEKKQGVFAEVNDINDYDSGGKVYSCLAYSDSESNCITPIGSLPSDEAYVYEEGTVARLNLSSDTHTLYIRYTFKNEGDILREVTEVFTNTWPIKWGKEEEEGQTLTASEWGIIDNTGDEYTYGSLTFLPQDIPSGSVAEPGEASQILYLKQNYLNKLPSGFAWMPQRIVAGGDKKDLISHKPIFYVESFTLTFTPPEISDPVIKEGGEVLAELAEIIEGHTYEITSTLKNNNSDQSLYFKYLLYLTSVFSGKGVTDFSYFNKVTEGNMQTINPSSTYSIVLEKTIDPAGSDDPYKIVSNLSQLNFNVSLELYESTESLGSILWGSKALAVGQGNGKYLKTDATQSFPRTILREGSSELLNERIFFALSNPYTNYNQEIIEGDYQIDIQVCSIDSDWQWKPEEGRQGCTTRFYPLAETFPKRLELSEFTQEEAATPSFPDYFEREVNPKTYIFYYDIPDILESPFPQGQELAVWVTTIRKKDGKVDDQGNPISDNRPVDQIKLTFKPDNFLNLEDVELIIPKKSGTSKVEAQGNYVYNPSFTSGKDFQVSGFLVETKEYCSNLSLSPTSLIWETVDAQAKVEFTLTYEYNGDPLEEKVQCEITGNFNGTIFVGGTSYEVSSQALATITLVPNNLPVACFNIFGEKDSFGATSTEFSFEDCSYDPDGAIEGWQWNFGDGVGSSQGQNPTYTYSETGTYEVTLIVTDDQGDTAVLSQNVYVVEVDLTWRIYNLDKEVYLDADNEESTDPIPYLICPSVTPDNDTECAFDKSGLAPGKYRVDLEAVYPDISEVVFRDSWEFRVNTPPVASFDIDPPPTPAEDTGACDDFTYGCDGYGHGYEFTFQNDSSDPDGDTLSCSWDFGDGETVEDNCSDQTHTFPALSPPDELSHTYSVTLTVSDGYETATVSQDVTIYNQRPIASFEIDPPDDDTYASDQCDEETETACDGLGLHTATFTLSDLSWDPDGDTLSERWWNIDLDGESPWDYTCGPTDCDTELPTFIKEINTSDLQNLTVSFEPGLYYVKLNVIDEYEAWDEDDGVRHMVEVTNNAPTVAFDIDPPPPSLEDTGSCDDETWGCDGYGHLTQEFTFQNDSSDPDGDTLSCSWDFGDGETVEDNCSDQTHTFPALSPPDELSHTYSVTLTVSDGYETATVSQDVTIYNQRPIASFEIDSEEDEEDSPSREECMTHSDDGDSCDDLGHLEETFTFHDLSWDEDETFGDSSIEWAWNFDVNQDETWDYSCYYDSEEEKYTCDNNEYFTTDPSDIQNLKVNFNQPGIYLVKLNVKDAYGFWDEVDDGVAHIVDVGSLPDTIITSGPNNLTNQSSATFEFKASPCDEDEGCSFECRLDEEDFEDCAEDSTTSESVTTGSKNYSDLAEDTYTFEVKATNQYGTGVPASYSWLVDRTLPTVDSFDAQPRLTKDTTEISWTVSDSGGSHLDRVEVWRAFDSNGDENIDSEEWGTEPLYTYIGPFDYSDSDSGSYSDTSTTEGTYWYGLHVVDKADNIGIEPAPIQVIVDKTPPLAILEPDSAEGAAPLEVKFTLDGEDENGLASWNFDCGNGVTTSGAGDPDLTTYNCTYDSQGSYTATLTVVDNVGLTGEDTASIAVSSPLPEITTEITCVANDTTECPEFETYFRQGETIYIKGTGTHNADKNRMITLILDLSPSVQGYPQNATQEIKGNGEDSYTFSINTSLLERGDYTATLTATDGEITSECDSSDCQRTFTITWALPSWQEVAP